jgi:hypothetical protein
MLDHSGSSRTTATGVPGNNCFGLLARGLPVLLHPHWTLGACGIAVGVRAPVMRKLLIDDFVVVVVVVVVVK